MTRPRYRVRSNLLQRIERPNNDERFAYRKSWTFRANSERSSRMVAIGNQR